MDFELLAKETLRLSESYRSIGAVDSTFVMPPLFEVDGLSDGPVVEQIPEDISQKVEINQSSGLLYRVDKGVNTFCIKGVVTDSLDDSINALEAGDKEILNRLKIKSIEGLNELQFFETVDILDGQKILKQTVNRRFPYNEELICNLSDPGMNWWMDIGDHDFQIYFTSNRIDRELDLLNLGPLGSPKDASKIFVEAIDLFRSVFGISEMSCSDKLFSVTFDTDKDEINGLLKDIFTKGILDEDFLEELVSRGGFEVANYLREISIIRSFWIELIDYLKE